MNPPKPSAPDLSDPKDVKEAYKEIDFSAPEHQLLSCPKCDHFISGSDINIEKTVAKCSQCHHAFGFEHDSSSPKLKPTLLIPDGIEVLKLKSELDLRLRWLDTTSKEGRWFMTLFAGFWNIIVLPFAIMAVVTGNWGILLFLSAHLAVGLGLIWHLGSIYINRTSISITKKKLKIRTMPFRQILWKNKEIEVDRINQFYVSRYVQSTTNDNPNYAYALYAILDTGEKVSLIRGMNRESQVYIEQEIEGFLGIKNKKVPDESAT